MVENSSAAVAFQHPAAVYGFDTYKIAFSAVVVDVRKPKLALDSGRQINSKHLILLYKINYHQISLH